MIISATKYPANAIPTRLGRLKTGDVVSRDSWDRVSCSWRFLEKKITCISVYAWCFGLVSMRQGPEILIGKSSRPH